MQIEIPRASMLLCAQTIQKSSSDAEACMAADAVLTYLKLTEPKPDPAPVTPRAGQVWKKLNTGTKTATSARRFRVEEIKGSMVFGWIVGCWTRMRITTLQRDWHCLNPKV